MLSRTQWLSLERIGILLLLRLDTIRVGLLLRRWHLLLIRLLVLLLLVWLLLNHLILGQLLLL